MVLILNFKHRWVSESHSVVSDPLQPPGLCSPRNSPGQNTGVGSLSLLQGISPTQRVNPGLPHCRQILYQLSHRGGPRANYNLTRKATLIMATFAQSYLTLCSPMDYNLPPGSSVHGILQARTPEWGCHSFLQEIFPTQELNLGLLHCRQILYHLNHQGSPSTKLKVFFFLEEVLFSFLLVCKIWNIQYTYSTYTWNIPS